ncbi:MAG: metal ABC transporter permease [Gemmataceae bacterium]
MDWFIEPLTYPFFRSALLGAAIIGLVCGWLSAYVVPRGMAFVGDGLAHSTLPGLALAYLWGWPLPIGGLLAAVLTAIGIGWFSQRSQLREDTAIGVVFTSMFAAGILLLTLKETYRDLSHILFGYILGVTNSDLVVLSGVAVLVVLTLMLFHKELELTSYDPIHAKAIGVSAHTMRYLLLVLLALAVVTCIQAVGVVFTVALLVTPGATGSMLSKQFSRVITLSVVVAVASAFLGLYTSWFADVSPGASIVLTCSGTFFVVWMAQTLRGPSGSAAR